MRFIRRLSLLRERVCCVETSSRERKSLVVSRHLVLHGDISAQLLKADGTERESSKPPLIRLGVPRRCRDIYLQHLYSRLYGLLVDSG